MSSLIHVNYTCLVIECKLVISMITRSLFEEIERVKEIDPRYMQNEILG